MAQPLDAQAQPLHRVGPADAVAQPAPAARAARPGRPGSGEPSGPHASPAAQAGQHRGRSAAYRAKSPATRRAVLQRRERRGSSASSRRGRPRRRARRGSRPAPGPRARRPPPRAPPAAARRPGTGAHGSSPPASPSAVWTRRRGEGKSTPAHTPSSPLPAPRRWASRCAIQRSTPGRRDADDLGGERVVERGGQHLAEGVDEDVGPFGAVQVEAHGSATLGRPTDKNGVVHSRAGRQRSSRTRLSGQQLQRAGGGARAARPRRRPRARRGCRSPTAPRRSGADGLPGRDVGVPVADHDGRGGVDVAQQLERLGQRGGLVGVVVGEAVDDLEGGREAVGLERGEGGVRALRGGRASR